MMHLLLNATQDSFDLGDLGRAGDVDQGRAGGDGLVDLPGDPAVSVTGG